MVASCAELTCTIAAEDPRGEIAHQALDTAKIQALGWRARIGLDEGLARSFAWYRDLAADTA